MTREVLKLMSCKLVKLLKSLLKTDGFQTFIKIFLCFFLEKIKKKLLIFSIQPFKDQNKNLILKRKNKRKFSVTIKDQVKLSNQLL